MKLSVVSRRIRRALAPAFAWTMTATVALAQAPPESPPTFHESIEVTAVTVAVRVEGRARGAALAAGDLVVREDGEPRRVVAVVRLTDAAAPAKAGEPAPAWTTAEARPTRLAIYVDVPMANSRTLATAVRRLAGMAEELVAAGEVEVVVADPEPQEAVAPTRDARRLAAGLRALAGRGGAFSVPERIRLPIVRGEDRLGGHRDLLLERAQEEIRYISARRTRLAVWAAGTPSYGRPRILFLVSGGYDSSPRDFYLDRLRESGGGGGGGTLVRQAVSERTLLETDLDRLAQGASEETLGSDLATLQWLVFPVAFADVGFATIGGAEESGQSRWMDLGRGAANGNNGTTPMLFTHPLAGWTTFATPSGGRALGSDRDLARSLRALDDLYLVTYERHGPLSGATHRLEIETQRPDLSAHAPLRVSEGTPESTAAVAAVRRLMGGPPEGDLPVALALRASRVAGGERDLTVGVGVDAAALAAAAGPGFGGAVRLTLAAPDGHGSARVLQKVVRAPAGTPGAWDFEVEARVPADCPRLVVRAEDLASGLAGSALLELAAGAP